MQTTTTNGCLCLLCTVLNCDPMHSYNYYGIQPVFLCFSYELITLLSSFVIVLHSSFEISVIGKHYMNTLLHYCLSLKVKLSVLFSKY